MKLLLTGIAMLSLFSGWILAQETHTNGPVKILATQARQHINAEAVVTGKIVEVNKAERVIHLNFERPFPGHPFEAVIFANRTNLFPDVDQLKGQRVEVSGRIVEYRNRPEIVLNTTNQLKLLDPATNSVTAEKK